MAISVSKEMSTPKITNIRSSITTRFSQSRLRANLRSSVLRSLGTNSKVSPGVHILAGHHMGREAIKDRVVFDRQLRGLAERAKLIDIEDACDLIGRHENVDEPLIAFTFDDGYSEWHSHIAPALEAHGVNAAFFVNPGYVHGDAEYIARFNRDAVHTPGKKPINAAQVKDLADRGFVIGAHTIDHADLTGSNSGFLQHQIADCKGEIQKLSGKECTMFAWTYGKFRHISPTALSIAKETYELVFSSDGYPSLGSNDGRVLNRRHFEPDWPVSHVKYFLRSKRFYE